MSNKQVILIFVLGIVMLFVAFWAGLSVIKGSIVSSSNQTAQKTANLPQPQKLDALFELAQDYLKAGLLDRAEELFAKLKGSPHAEAVPPAERSCTDRPPSAVNWSTSRSRRVSVSYGSIGPPSARPAYAVRACSDSGGPR